MTKSDLRTGMIVTCRNGYKYILICDARISEYACKIGGFGIGGGAFWEDFDEFNSDLTCPNQSEFDVVKIEILDDVISIRSLINGHKVNLSTIWTREEKKKYTYSQLKEILGEEFEIVKE